MTKADIGVIGLAVMGRNLVLNMNDHGFTVAVYNRTKAKTDAFLAGPAHGTGIIGCATLGELVHSLKRPRRIMLMVKAGPVVDHFIDQLIPLLAPGDTIIDGGNSLYTDSNRRSRQLADLGLGYIGTGISGGEEGARHGPSIMPGGHASAWPQVRDIFQAIAAKVDGTPCCDWIGEDGAGHFVKMVHNGIEYGDMQLICEAYDILHRGLGLDAATMAVIFNNWNRGRLNSYLIEITADILKHNDTDGVALVAKILDTAGQKGTGKWTAINALELGVPLTLISEAVFARCLSALYDQRQRAAAALTGPEPKLSGPPEQYIDLLEEALYAAKIISYGQGYMLLHQAAQEYGWRLDYGGIALLWRGGCIIRSAFLTDIATAYHDNPGLENLLLADFFRTALATAQEGWRTVVSAAVRCGLPLPAMGAALTFYDGFRSGRLPANLLQAQRDYFGAHTYQRLDRPATESYHSDWTGHGGDTPATSYRG